MTSTQRTRHHHVCLVSEAFYRSIQQVVVSNRAAHCIREHAKAGPAISSDISRPWQAWIVSSLPWPVNAVASIRLANATAHRLGWRWKWLLFADDDCLVTPSRDLQRALRGLRARVPWYIGTLDSMWSPGGLSAAGLGAAPTVVQPEDRLRLRLCGAAARRVLAVDAFPACTFPTPLLSGFSLRVSKRCTLQPRADASLGCRWGSVTAACDELWRRDSSGGVTALAPPNSGKLGEPYGYGTPMTILVRGCHSNQRRTCRR